MIRANCTVQSAICIILLFLNVLYYLIYNTTFSLDNVVQKSTLVFVFYYLLCIMSHPSFNEYLSLG